MIVVCFPLFFVFTLTLVEHLYTYMDGGGRSRGKEWKRR